MTPDDIRTRSGRVRVRYMAAAHPHLNINRLAEAVWDDLGRPDIGLSDLRLILRGRSLRDPAKVVESLPVERIQAVGAILAEGGGAAAASRATGVGLDTVRAIDTQLGLRERHRQAVRDAVTELRAQGASTRAISRQLTLPRTTVQRLVKEVEA